MAVAPISATPPSKTPVVTSDRLVHATWLIYFNVLTEFVRQFVSYKDATQAFVDSVNDFMAAVNANLEVLNAFVARFARYDIAYDPPSIGPGLAHTVDVSATGVKVGDIVSVSFAPAAAGMTLLAQATAADTVSVTFLNVSGGAIDLGAGTIRLSVEAV